MPAAAPEKHGAGMHCLQTHACIIHMHRDTPRMHMHILLCIPLSGSTDKLTWCYQHTPTRYYKDFQALVRSLLFLLSSSHLLSIVLMCARTRTLCLSFSLPPPPSTPSSPLSFFLCPNLTEHLSPPPPPLALALPRCLLNTHVLFPSFLFSLCDIHTHTLTFLFLSRGSSFAFFTSRVLIHSVCLFISIHLIQTTRRSVIKSSAPASKSAHCNGNDRAWYGNHTPSWSNDRPHQRFAAVTWPMVLSLDLWVLLLSSFQVFSLLSSLFSLDMYIFMYW